VVSVDVAHQKQLLAAFERVERLIAKCEAQQRSQGGPSALIVLKVPNVPPGRDRVRFSRRNGPFGQVLDNTLPNGVAAVGWKADELLDFLRPHLAELRGAANPTLLNRDEYPSVPAWLAVCPICRSEVFIDEIDEWEQLGDGTWIAVETGVKVTCITEPEIDHAEWENWNREHFSMPYVDWLPICESVSAWLRLFYRIRTDEEK
jgi:hypothetical protein